MNQIAHFIDRHRRLVSFALIALTAFSLAGMARLEYAVEPRTEIRGDGSDFEFLEGVFEDFGSDDFELIVLVTADDLFVPDALAALRRLVSEIGQVDGVIEVHSLDDVLLLAGGLPRPLLPKSPADPSELRRAREAALSHPVVRGQLLSLDARTTLVAARVDSTLLTIDRLEPVVQQVRQRCQRIAAESNLVIQVTGLPGLRVDIYSTLRRENRKFIAAGPLVAGLMALVLFRRLSGLVITATPPLLGTLWTLGCLGWLDQRITVITTVVPTLILVIGFADAVHLMVHLRHEAARGRSARAASLDAVRQLGRACGLTSLTTAVGFGSLVLASSPTIQQFGSACALGAMLTFVAVITTVPLLAGTPLGEWSVSHVSVKRTGRTERFLEHLVGPLLDHARPVAVVGIVATVALASTALWLKPDMNMTESLSPESESVRAFETYEAAFGGGMVVQAVVDWNGSEQDVPAGLFAALRSIHDLFDADPFTAHPMSVLSLVESTGVASTQIGPRLAILALLPGELVERFYRLDRRRALVTAHVRDVGAAASLPAMQRLDAKLAEISERHDGIALRLTGTPVVATRTVHTMLTDLGKSLSLASVIIFAVMSLAFRSLAYGLVSVIPNAFPLAVTSAFLVFTGRPLQLSSLIVFTVCLGIAVDDTIHVLTRYRRELERSPGAREAVRRSFVAVGRALAVTTLVFLAGFGTVLTSVIPLIQLYAWLSCLAIAAALVGDLVILPALMVCFLGKRSK